MADLLDLMRAPAIRRPVDPDGAVISGAADETLRLPHQWLAWDIAAIELHRHTDGLWMWSTHHAGGGYKVGPKWGKFAPTRDDALYYAVRELLAELEARRPETSVITHTQITAAIRWANRLL